MRTHYILSDLEGCVLCGMYHIRRLKKAQLRTPVENVTTYDELKTALAENNTSNNQTLPNVSNAAITQSFGSS